ncbi:MAG: hypothetical protein O7A64_08990 [Alphaproteobacteria bacterium]|nr:hypothetical protein [Alphaproteobacteria bacterium]
MLEKGIYIEIKSVQLTDDIGVFGKLHSYLVFRDGKGNARVIRGGPPAGKSLKAFAKAAAGGDIEVQADVALQRSKDRYGPDDTPQSRHARKLDLGGREPEEVWKGMVERAKAINGAEIDYDVITQNSNSVTRAALESGRVDPNKSIPPGIDKGDLTGFDNDLSKPKDIFDTMFDEKDDEPLDDPNLASRGDKDSKQKRTAVFRARRETALTRELGADADDLRNSSPDARKFLDDVVKPGSPADEILLKPVARWTDDELGVVMGTRLDLPSGHPERNRMADKETEFFKRFHGVGATPPIPKDPTPARAPDGGDLTSALRRVGAHVVRAAGRDGLPPALSDLQRGINFKRDAATALTVDGAFGPRTRSALRRATADLGSAGVERLLALGRFHGFAEDAERDGPADLKDTLEAVFANPGRTPARPVGALKRMLNDLGRIHFGGDAWRPLDDGEGRIGPETTSAFAKVLRAAGPTLLAERFGRFLGIL